MTNRYPIIVSGLGGGGKGGSPHAATEAPNSLRSKQIAHVIDLLGEGEWEGLIDGPAGIYLNDVPLFSPTSPTGDVISLSDAGSDGGWSVPGSWNFKGITVEFRNGTQSQPAIKTASSVSSVQGVNLAVTHATPITAAISNPNIDTGIVDIQVDSLYQQDPTDGSISGYYVDLTINARLTGGSWAAIVKDRIEGKTMNGYVRQYAIDLRAIGVGPWEIQVVRDSADDPDSSKHSNITFLGVNLMSRDKFRYPNSVLCSVGVDASQMNSIPTRSYDCKMLRVRVPTNYDPVARTYSGVWDGSFKIAWTDNPAWCIYDLATSARYGLGNYVSDLLTDKWALYTIAQYCDAMVPDGFGGSEPRFRMNAYISTADEAITMLQSMASAFRSVLYYLGSQVTFVMDSPSDPVYHFTPSNVVDGVFSYAGASGSARHTVAMVVWNNPEIGYQQDVEVVEDHAGLVRFGYRSTTIQAFGCTSRGQAHRVGLWALYVEQNEADIVTFSTALEGTGIQPGAIIEVYDPTRANIRLGGRVLSSNPGTQTFAMDATVNLPTGTHTVKFVADDGSLVSRTTTVSSGAFSSIVLDGSGTMPSPGSIFGIQTSSVMSQLFRVLSISESHTHTYEISAVAHNPNKYAYVEQNVVLGTRPIRALDTPLSGPGSITFQENLYFMADGSIGDMLTASWPQDTAASGYMVSYKIGSGNWSDETFVEAHSFGGSVQTGVTYSIRVTPISLTGLRGSTTENSYTTLGTKAAPPPFDVLNVTQQSDGTRQINFGYTTTAKPIDYAGAHIRYYAGTTTDWTVMTDLATGLYTTSPIETNQYNVSGTYTIAAKAIDKTNHESTPIFTTVTLTDGRTPVATISDARTRIDAIQSDNLLSMGEKRANEVLWNQIVSFYNTKDAEATTAGITTEKTDFETAYNALGTYLTTAYNSTTHQGVGTGGSDWSNVNTDSQIDGPTFRAKFQAVFDKAEVLVKALTNVAATKANWANVTGAGKPADGADVTSTILGSSGTSIVMSNANLFKSASGVAGVFIGSGGLIGKDSGGTTTFSIDGASGAASFNGSITGASSLTISGQATFDGSFASGSGWTTAMMANNSWNASVGGTFKTNTNFINSGYAVLGNAQNGGCGVYGLTGGGSPGGYGGFFAATSVGTGLRANGTLGATALSVTGPMTIDNTTLVANLNAQYLNGHPSSDFVLTTDIPKAFIYQSTAAAAGAFQGYVVVQSKDGTVGPVKMPYYAM